MAFRFRKSFKIAPGVRVNLGKSGFSSISVGPRGASMSFGKSGIYSNVGIPGTGISFRNKVGRTSSKREEKRIQRLEEEKRRVESLSSISLNLDEENGSLTILNAFNEPLSRKDLKLMWEQKGDLIQEWLQDEAIKINGDNDLLENIYLDTPAPNSVSKYIAKEYYKSAPQKPNIPNEPTKEQIPALGFFAGFFKSKKEEYQQKVQKAEDKYIENLEKWEFKKEKILKEYEEKLKKWNSQKEDYERKEKYYEENFSTVIRTDMEFMEKIIEEVFDSLSWPRETIISYEINNEGSVVWVDVDLPEIEDLPQKVATIAASGKKLNIKNKTKKQLQLEYAKHIHGIAFRLVGTVFAILPKVEEIVISGYSQRLDKATGKVNNDYLYSYKINRTGFEEIDFGALEFVNPIESLDRFEHKKKMTSTGIFKAIEPYKK
jgi:hypothetical protein